MNLWDSRLPPRFWRKIFVTPDGCWQWTGAASGERGQIQWKCDDGIRRRVTVYRLAFRAANGSIDPSLVLDHLCENPRCCNPAHLEQVTSEENTRRHYERHPAEVCRNGHPKTEDNVYLQKRKNGHTRICKTCHASQVSAYLERIGRAPLKTHTNVDSSRIIRIRESLGVNQAKFAKLVGVSASTVSGWELGRVRPMSDAAARIEALGAGAETEAA